MRVWALNGAGTIPIVRKALEGRTAERRDWVKGDSGWLTGFEPAISRSTIWCLNR